MVKFDEFNNPDHLLKGILNEKQRFEWNKMTQAFLDLRDNK